MSGSIVVSLVVDGDGYDLTVDPIASLLTVLRDRLGLTATKDACHQGECGSCSVWLDDLLVCSCLVPAAQLDGTVVRTVASADVRIRGVQEALARVGAVQCGFCTPGIAVAAADLLARVDAPSGDELTEALEGNLCRCTGYTRIVEAVRSEAQGRP